MADKSSILAILELDCFPDLLLKRTAWLANGFNLNVHLVLFEPGSGALLSRYTVSTEADTLRKDLERIQEELVEQYAADLRSDGLEVTTSVLRERPLADSVVQLALDMEPKVVAKCVRYHNQAERSTFVDSDWQLTRNCPYPLWFVKAEEIPEKPLIVAAVDPSHAHDKPAALDYEIVRAANAVAEAAGGQTHLLHVYERIAGIGAAANRELKPVKLPVDEIDARVGGKHREALDALAEATGVPADRVHQLPGRTEEVLPAYTRSEGAAVVVMGALARWGLKRMVIGSTAERTIDHFACDVLIVRLGDRQIYDDWKE